MEKVRFVIDTRVRGHLRFVCNIITGTGSLTVLKHKTKILVCYIYLSKVHSQMFIQLQQILMLLFI